MHYNEIIRAARSRAQRGLSLQICKVMSCHMSSFDLVLLLHYNEIVRAARSRARRGLSLQICKVMSCHMFSFDLLRILHYNKIIRVARSRAARIVISDLQNHKLSHVLM